MTLQEEADKKYSGKWFIHSSSLIKVRIMGTKIVEHDDGRKSISIIFGESIDIPEENRLNIQSVSVITLESYFTPCVN